MAVAEGSLSGTIIVGDDRLFPREVEGAIQAAELDVGGGRPDKMISRVTGGEGGESGK